MESVVGVALSGDSAESIRDDILLCQLMNKLHPGTIHVEVRTDTASVTSWPQSLVCLHICNNALSKTIQDTAVNVYLLQLLDKKHSIQCSISIVDCTQH